MTVLWIAVVAVVLGVGICCCVYDVELVWAPAGAEGLVLRSAPAAPARLTIEEWNARQGAAPVWHVPGEGQP
jgi:hypothetical protein